jgi:fibronectin type 3 domain-containing protein
MARPASRSGRPRPRGLLAGLALACALGIAPRASGQSPATGAPSLRLVATGDTVLVYLAAAPPVPARGFVVYRRLIAAAGAAGAGWVKRTATPVEPERDPSVAAGRLGPDLPMAMRAVRAVDATEMLRRLSRDPFAAGVLSLLSRGAAAVLGRLFVDTAAAVGADYEYRVAFTDASGAETGRSVAGGVRVADVTPAPPAAPASRSADHEIVLTWHYPAFTGSPADLVVGFHVYRASGAGGGGRRLTATPVLRNDAPGAVLTFRDGEPSNGVPYRYWLTAVDVAGRESAPSPAVTARARDDTPPGAPAGLAVKNGDGLVTVTWSLAPEADVAGYHIERSTGLSKPFARLDHALIPAAQPLWTDTVPGGRQYFYRVVAVDSAGLASGPSNPVSAEPDDRTPPAPPTALSATAEGRRITIRWSASPSSDVRGYWVYRGESGRFVRLVSRPLQALTFTDSGYAGNPGALARLTPGARYVVRVSAVDSAFNESVKVEAQVLVPDDRPPAPPSALRVENVRGRYVSVSWDASADRDVARYLLSRTGGGPRAGFGQTFPAAARAWRDTAVVHGERYVYRLTAVDSAGNASGPVTDSVTFRDFTPPPAPRAASARLVAGLVLVRWERVVSAELVGYRVYRSALPTGVFERLTAAPVTVLSFADSTGRAGLFYAVRAVDRSGNESAASPVAGVTPR